MRYWQYVEPDENMNPIYHTVSEDDIVKEYMPWWEEQMTKANKQHLISKENCILDFTTVHWAVEVIKEE